jgi:WW domain
MSSPARKESEQVEQVATPPAPNSSTPELSTTTSSLTTTWQAIFAPQYNTYYFYNPVTQETTWVNPLEQQQESQPEASTSTSTTTITTPVVDMETAALAQGIDPLLAHLDPSLLAPSVPGGSGPLPSFTARFNSRTGQFTPASARTPGHLSEHERAKRMSEFYFDVGKWEEDLARRGGRLMGEEDATGEEGSREKKRKRPSKKDLVCISAFSISFCCV